MNKEYYAAAFAQDVDVHPELLETIGYSSGICSLAVLVGTAVETERKIARDNSRDFWPMAAAEAAAQCLNTMRSGSFGQIQGDILRAAMLEGYNVGITHSAETNRPEPVCD